MAVEHSEDAQAAVETAVDAIGGYPLMLKARRDAYDGRGNFPLTGEAEIPEGLNALAGRDLYVEQWVSFEMELAVVVVKTDDKPDTDWKTGTIRFGVVESVK